MLLTPLSLMVPPTSLVSNSRVLLLQQQVLNFNYVDVTSPGTADASKALVVDGSKSISGINSLTVMNLNVQGTTTTVDTVTMQATNAIQFEGLTCLTPTRLFCPSLILHPITPSTCLTSLVISQFWQPLPPLRSLLTPEG